MPIHSVLDLLLIMEYIRSFVMHYPYCQFWVLYRIGLNSNSNLTLDVSGHLLESLSTIYADIEKNSFENVWRLFFFNNTLAGINQ